jgi:hypothetical protein
MRPVTRGNAAASYTTRETRLAAVAARLLTDFASQRKVRGDLDVLEEEMGEEQPQKRRRVNDPNATFAGLQQAAVPLLADYTRAKMTPGTSSDTIFRKGDAYRANLNLQSELLKARIASDTEELMGEYSYARGGLVANLGQYCSFCEMPLAASLAVEHMLPKVYFPNLAASWSNFLLACTICNSVKTSSPSRRTAEDKALRLHPPSPTIAQVQAAGYSLLLWPSDAAARYANFTNHFQYVLRKVRYAGEDLYSALDLATADTAARILNNTIFHRNGADLIEATFYDEIALGGLSHMDAGTFLTGVTLEVDLATTPLPPGFKTSLVGAHILDNNDHSFVLAQATPRPTSPAGVRAWRLKESFKFQISTLRREIGIVSGGNTLLIGGTSSKAVAPALKHNILIEDVAKYWNVNTWDWKLEWTPASGSSTYDVTLSRDVLFEWNPTTNTLWAARMSTSAVEVEIRVVIHGNADLQAAASQTIVATGLNRRAPNDIKASDRRVVKRTRAWFTAANTIRRLSTARTSGSPVYQDLLTAAKHTMTGTGFWSVWYSLVTNALGVGAPVRRDLLQHLQDVSNFPGTR